MIYEKLQILKFFFGFFNLDGEKLAERKNRTRESITILDKAIRFV